MQEQILAFTALGFMTFMFPKWAHVSNDKFYNINSLAFEKTNPRADKTKSKHLKVKPLTQWEMASYRKMRHAGTKSE